MNDNFNTRMILTTAAFAAVAALLVGPASAHVMDIEGGGVDESQSSGQPSVELSGDTALKVDRAVAAANEAYEAILAEASARQAAQSPAASVPSIGGKQYVQGVTSLTQVERAAAFGAYQPPSWWGKGGKGEETGGATNPLQRTVATAPTFPSGDELDTAISTAMATRAARESGTLSGKQQNTSDVVSRYLGNDRMGTGQFPVGYRGRP
jgi:hypothetical protein